MKKQLFSLTIVLTFLFVPFLLKGQGNYEDVVYLKNGSIIHGMIIEQVFEQSVKIKTRDNNIFVFQWNEIEKITKATVSKPRLFHNPGQTDNVYFGFFAGSTFAKLRPDAQKVCDDLAYSMNQEAGFSEFSFSPESRVGFAAGYYVYRRITGSLSFRPNYCFR